jgi:hypothetical protein
MYARAGNILLSLLGPAYFGFMHSPYVVLVVCRDCNCAKLIRKYGQLRRSKRTLGGLVAVSAMTQSGQRQCIMANSSPR